MIQYEYSDDLPFTGSWKDHPDVLFIQINIRGINEQIKELHPFSLYLQIWAFFSRVAFLRWLIVWTVSWAHWGRRNSVCFLDCYCTELYLSQKKGGTWKAPSNVSDWFRHANCALGLESFHLSSVPWCCLCPEFWPPPRFTLHLYLAPGHLRGSQTLVKK